MTLAGGFHYRHHFMGERAEAWRARATEMVRVGLGTRTQVSGFMIRASRHCLIAPHYVQTEPGKRRGLGAAHLGPRGCPPRGAGAQYSRTPHSPSPAGWNFLGSVISFSYTTDSMRLEPPMVGSPQHQNPGVHVMFCTEVGHPR